MSTSEGVQFGIGFLGVALAFGLTAVTMSHAVGRVSGIPVTSTSVNPARSIGPALVACGRGSEPLGEGGCG